LYAARLQLLETKIKPSLDKGQWVLLDRHELSTFAYQCGGRGLLTKDLEELERWVQTRMVDNQSYLLQPQTTFLFDLSPQAAELRRSATRNPDKFEELDLDFFNRVRQEYLRRASNHPQRFVLIDSSLSISTIQEQLKTRIASM
jgi:dTMP kinase